jgi:hypothetical protein
MAKHLETYIGARDRDVSAANAGIGVWLLDSKRLTELDEIARLEAGGPDAAE